MKNITVYCFCIIVFLFIALFMACESQRHISFQELAYQTHFQIETSGVFTSEPIGVYMVDDGFYEMCNNLKYINKNGIYSLVDSSGLCSKKIKNDKVIVYAYAPYREGDKSGVENHQIEVYPDQRDSINYVESDFLYVKVNNKDLSADTIGLSFNNSLARLTINIKNSNLLKSDNVFFEIINIATSININLRTGTFFDPENIEAIKPFEKKKANSGFDHTLEAILVPQNIQKNTSVFKFRIDGKDYCYTTKYDVNLESAMQYICNITLDSRGLSVESEEFPRKRDSVLDNVGAVSERVYKIGDFYPIADDPLSAIGVVFSTVDNGAHGKILSLNEAVDLEWGPSVETGAKSKISGGGNKAIIERSTNSIAEYRALNWCLSKGKDWYLPAINELAIICKQKEILNRALSPLLRSNNLGNGVYVSSTEDSESKVLVLHFGNGQRFLQDKSLDFHVRAVCDF